MPSWARFVATATSGSAAERRGVLRDVERARRRRCRRARRRSPSRSSRAQLARRLDAAALDHHDVRVRELRPQHLGDLLALAGADRDRDVAAARDPAVGEQRRQRRDRARPDVDRQRACRPSGSAAARDLPRPREVGVVVDLDPLDRRRSAPCPRARRGRRTPGSRPRSRAAGRAARSPRAPRRARSRGLRLDQREPDVLALRGGRVERLVDPVEQPLVASGGPSSPPRRAASRRRRRCTSSASPRAASSGSSTSAGCTVSPLHSSTPSAKWSRAHHSE